MVGNHRQFRSELKSRIDGVFAAHPALEDRRSQYPWLTGSLGDPYADVWFVAENPSLRQLQHAPSEASPELQWSVSAGDLLFREMLVNHGFKPGGVHSPGGWCCYITNVVKSADFAKQWNKKSLSERHQIAEWRAPVLAWELYAGQPKLIVSLRGKVDDLLDRLIERGMIPRPRRCSRIHHYNYIAFRPDGKRRLSPMDPVRLREYSREFDFLGLRAP